MPIKKQTQLTIKKAFKRAETRQDDDTEDLQDEIKLLEQQLQEKQNHLFDLKKEKYRRKIPLTRNKKSDTVLSVESTKIILATNEVQNLKDSIFMISMLSGMEIQSLEPDDHCTVVFHMQHDSENELKHGLKIDLRNGKNEICESSLPLGFNLAAVIENHDVVMSSKCLSAIRNALITYYDRLDQFKLLQKSIFMDAQLFKTLDTSHIEISFSVIDERDPNEDTIDVILLLDYRIHDIRPKLISIKNEIPDIAEETILQQCNIFKKEPLKKAFVEAFVKGFGPYKLAVEEPDSVDRSSRPRPKQHHPAHLNNDDTFNPEDCSESEYDEEG